MKYEIWNNDHSTKLDEREADNPYDALTKHLHDMGYTTAVPQASLSRVILDGTDKPAEGLYNIYEAGKDPEAPGVKKAVTAEVPGIGGTDTKESVECIVCGATDDEHGVTVEVVRTSTGIAQICNICQDNM